MPRRALRLAPAVLFALASVASAQALDHVLDGTGALRIVLHHSSLPYRPH